MGRGIWIAIQTTALHTRSTILKIFFFWLMKMTTLVIPTAIDLQNKTSIVNLPITCHLKNLTCYHKSHALLLWHVPYTLVKNLVMRRHVRFSIWWYYSWYQPCHMSHLDHCHVTPKRVYAMFADPLFDLNLFESKSNNTINCWLTI